MEASPFFMFSRVLQQVQSPGLNGNGNMRKQSELYCVSHDTACRQRAACGRGAAGDGWRSCL